MGSTKSKPYRSVNALEVKQNNARELKQNASYELTYQLNTGSKISTYYINLDKRLDRRQQIEGELKRTNLVPYSRISGILNAEFGMLGCGLSHIKSLKQGIESGADHILIFEDDFYFVMEPELTQRIIQTVILTNYDVFLLGYCVEDKELHTHDTNNKLFKKIHKAQCCHGYMVSKRYAPKLLRNFEEGVNMLQKTKQIEKYACDVYWKRLQEEDMWVCASSGPCGKQRAGYSDIVLHYKNESITNIKEAF
jgi:hypothetical protein